MKPTALVGNYVFHLEGIMWANSLKGGKFHPVGDVVISDVLPERTVITKVERPIMTGFLGTHYTTPSWPFANGAWPPSPPPPPSSAGVPPAYLPNVGFYPFSEIGRFEFSADGSVDASIRWNFTGIVVDDFKAFSGRYQLNAPASVGKASDGGTVSLKAPSVNGSPQWDYVFLFTNTKTRKEAVLMAAGRMPRPATASGRMIKEGV